MTNVRMSVYTLYYSSMFNTIASILSMFCNYEYGFLMILNKKQLFLFYFIQTWRRKQTEKVVTALSTKDDPLKMVKQLWTKHVGF
jgi:hypothetical protein